MQRPVKLIEANGAKCSWFFMMMKEIYEIDGLECDLCDLEVIEYHVVLQHLLHSPMMIIEYE